MGWLFFKVGRSNAYLEVQRNKVRDTLEGSKAIYYCFTHSHAQSTNNQLMYRNNCSITTGAMDAATCDDFVAGKFAPAQGGALTAPCESCGQASTLPLCRVAELSKAPERVTNKRSPDSLPV